MSKRYLPALSLLSIITMLAGCAQMDLQKRERAIAEVEQYCIQLYKDQRLSPIREKVPINLSIKDSIPMSMMASNARATDEEKTAILVWAEQRQACQQNGVTVLGPPPAHLEALRSANSQAMADLYAGSISYGDFAKQLNQNRTAFLQTDQAIRAQATRDAMQAQQIFQQQLYQQQQLNLQQQQIQNDQLRAPHPVNCTTRYVGNQAYTNCQ